MTMGRQKPMRLLAQERLELIVQPKIGRRFCAQGQLSGVREVVRGNCQ